MKKYNKTHCPDSIEYKGEIYTINIEATHKHREGKLQSRYHIIVNVMSNNLKGRTDLHGNLYKPSVFIYSSERARLDEELPRRTMTAKEYKRHLAASHYPH